MTGADVTEPALFLLLFLLVGGIAYALGRRTRWSR
jgi:hypothetical protein